MRRPSRCAALTVVGLLAGPVQGAAPYPPSSVITGITWDTATYRWGGDGGDLWPVTWAADGALLSAWGDGTMGCAKKASYGVARLASEQPGTALTTLHCGPGPTNKGKLMALLATGDGLFARFGPQGTVTGFPIWKSANDGRTWAKSAAPLPFLIDAFVQFGRGNAGAPGAYEYFSGSSGAPAWSKARAQSRPIFADPAGAWRPSITYDPGLKRYLLAVAHAKDIQRSADRIGIFEAPSPWGPWRTVSYVDNFLGIPDGEFWGMNFPIKWQADGGRTLWATFSCHHGALPKTCGVYHDRLNLMRARLTVR